MFLDFPKLFYWCLISHEEDFFTKTEIQWNDSELTIDPKWAEPQGMSYAISAVEPSKPCVELYHTGNCRCVLHGWPNWSYVIHKKVGCFPLQQAKGLSYFLPRQSRNKPSRSSLSPSSYIERTENFRDSSKVTQHHVSSCSWEKQLGIKGSLDRLWSCGPSLSSCCSWWSTWGADGRELAAVTLQSPMGSQSSY